MFNFWKEKYQIEWCELCNTAIITCPDCNNSSCSGSGCEKCHNVFSEFNKISKNVGFYLSMEENKIYEKCLRLKSLIRDSLGRGEKKLDFNKLKEEGRLSENDLWLFNLK